MDEIVLKKALPVVFEERRSLINSDVWLKELSFKKGETVLIEADSGTGKSSLCSYIFGYRKDFTGQICFDSTDINKLKVKDWVELREKSLSILWQELRLFPELSAWENVMIKNNLTHFQTEQQISSWFELLGIRPFCRPARCVRRCRVPPHIGCLLRNCRNTGLRRLPAG